MSKHTPGPWRFDTEDGGVRYVTASNGAITVAVPHGPPGNCVEVEPEHIANAHLIAAAPEMLDALKKARSWAGQYFELPAHEAAANIMCGVLDAAIAKAEGRADAKPLTYADCGYDPKTTGEA